MNRTMNWANQTMEEYLFERFREDKIEDDIDLLMALNKENDGKQSENAISKASRSLLIDKITRCEDCPVFDGWKDQLGFPVVKCKLNGEILQGFSRDLFGNIHHGQATVTFTVITDSP